MIIIKDSGEKTLVGTSDQLPRVLKFYHWLKSEAILAKKGLTKENICDFSKD